MTLCLLCPDITFFVARIPNSTPDDFLKDVIYENWLKTDGAGDFTGDSVCNMEDWVLVSTDPVYYRAWLTVEFGVVWGTL